jgi:cytochrome c-type biogenesis protein CcmH/NrfG
VSVLDEYFAGRLDHAVNVWTRVLFLDRANDRARAYIDRARRAQAEQQRETEALVHQ